MKEDIDSYNDYLIKLENQKKEYLDITSVSNNTTFSIMIHGKN